MIRKLLIALGIAFVVSSGADIEATENGELVIEATGPGGAPTQRLRITETEGTALVTYEESGVERLAAAIEVSAEGIVVSGFVCEVPFAWILAVSTAGGVKTKHEHGAATFEAEIVGQPSDQDLDRFASFQESVRNGPAGPVVQAFTRLVQQSAADMPASAAAFATLAGRAAGGPIVPLGPFQDFVDCLEEACKEVGGCWSTGPWSTGCVICKGTPWYEAIAVAMLYDFGAEICFFQLISPIK